MKNSFYTASLVCSLFLMACGNTEGLSEESSRPMKGNANSPVVVSEYADLQCPACRAAHSEILEPLVAQYGNQVAFEFNHFPIRSIHRYALEAAMAAECAADQGKFWEFIDHTYENQPEMTMDAISQWGADIGVDDVDLYERCLRSQIKRDTVNDDYQEGRELGVSGTPTFFVNGTRVETNLNSLRAAIEAQLSANTQPL